jgi:hypothetical protein
LGEGVNVEIVVETNSLSRGARGSVTGRIFLRHAHGVFPEEGWSDFPVVILTWWVTGLSECARGERSSFQGLFMDGPCSFTVTRDDRGTLELACRGSDLRSTLVGVSARDLLESALVAARRVSSACRERGWISGDIVALRAALASTQGAV